MTTDQRLRTYGGDPINGPFGPGRWQDALRRMRSRIQAGIKLNMFDSTAPGDKDTHCSWGMCSNDKEQWPDPNDHMFPQDHLDRGRISSRRSQEDQWCPMDRRVDKRSYIKPTAEAGCFYRCKMFNPGHEKRPDRERTLQLYDEVIAEYEQTHGVKVTADDQENYE